MQPLPQDKNQDPRPAPSPRPQGGSDPAVASRGDTTSENGHAAQAEDLSQAVAVVGMGCVLPRANNVGEFWQVVKDGVDCIREVPTERWDPDLFYDPQGTGDKSYTKIGGFLTDFKFNPIEFRIPPKSGEALDPLQRMTLVAAREAFVDAGYLDERLKTIKEFDRDRTAVVLGNSMGGELQRKYTQRISLPLIEKRLQAAGGFSGLDPAQKERIIAEFSDNWNSNLPPITEDSMPGELSNIVSGRVANVFDLRGKNHTTDAACASSFAALDMAVKSLFSGECDLVVTGGADRSMDIDTYVKFCKIGALSATGSTPFDKRADGFVMGEGCAVFLLKRLADAVRDGDKIHAVLRGQGSSSDGRGKGITAPNKRGQVLAVRRGLERSGVAPGSIQYMEAHGTSTRVGDVVEVEALSEALAPGDPAPGSVGLGSVKSQLGHLKSAAGAASLLKTILAFKHSVLPPSINFETPNPNIDWQRVPFRVVTQAEAWPENRDGLPRRAGISSFGFGGTNFHVVLEEYLPSFHDRAVKAAVARPGPVVSASSAVTAVARQAPPPMSREEVNKSLAARAHLEAETLVLGAGEDEALKDQLAEIAGSFPESTFLETGEGPRLKDLVHRHNVDGVKSDHRVALVASSSQDVRDQARFALSCLDDEKRMRMAPVKGVFFGEGIPKGKLAFLFPGQGSQYAEMLLDLHEKYAVVRDTFREADDVLLPFLGVRLTSLVFPEHDRTDEAARKAALKEADEALRRTEICQPAVLTVDIALWRLLRSVGIEPDAVAGHSLGEYAALVAAGILRFEDALLAVSARGKEMANVDVPDHGKMASITADPVTIQGVLDGIEDYVIMANKNCPSMTVIAGSTPGVEKAVAVFRKQGVQANYIPVSAAFHSQIVAPATQPLGKLLRRLSVRRPHTPIYANVTGRRYEDHEDPEAFHEYTVDLLSQQIASAVEWTKTIENMHEEGVHYFLEVGPKRALTAFVQDILKEKEFMATATNHPKKGGVHHFNETYAAMSASGFIPKVKHPQAISHYTPEHLEPLGPGASDREQAALPAKSPKEPPGPTLETPAQATTTNGSEAKRSVGDDPVSSAFSTNELRTLARQQGFLSYARSQAPVVSAMLRAGWESARRSGALPSDDPMPEDEHPVVSALPPGFQYDTGDIVIAGASVGLPGRDRPFFDDRNAESILDGENRIDSLTQAERGWMTDKNIIRLRKAGDGSADFEHIDDPSKVIKLAGVPGRLDIVEDFGVDKKFQEALDITSELAVGAAIDALRDAGIPLVRNYQRTSTGSHLPGDWVLPPSMQDDTGVIFASAWPGLNNLVDELTRFLTQKHKGQARDVVEGMLTRVAEKIPDPAQREAIMDWIREETAGITTTDQDEVYEFNRRFVFRILAMGHAQVAQLLKAKGPNTQVNAACSSTTLAVAVAEDWIRTGRAKRVLVLGADAPTKAPLFEWLSAGFLAAGAATTEGELSEAALPFDRRRHGMINGCGAVGLVVERRADVKARGMDGLVRLLATQVANSGYHASRLDVDHVAEQMERVVALAQKRYGLDRSTLAKDLVFMSHETYTPARGGSASAEIKSLRKAFGDDADQVLVTNTKGFTGHPHAASIEDAIAVKMLQLGKVPPIPNLKERDPELGNLNLSTGGETDRRYTLRLAAGFGSQITLWVGECLTRGTDRIMDEARHHAWLRSISGQEAPRLEVVQRRLRVVDTGPPPRLARRQKQPADEPAPEPEPVPAPTPAPASAPQVDLQQAEPGSDGPMSEPVVSTPTPTASAASSPAAPSVPVHREKIVKSVVEMVVEQTGYPEDMLEGDLDLEADLGIDTVKQAELFGLLREKYALPQEEGIQIKDYPTLNHIADYIISRMGGTKPAVAPAPQEPTTTPSQPLPEAAQGTTSSPPREPTEAQPTAVSAPSAKAPAGGPDSGSPGEAVGREEAMKQLVDLVAEQTGYPQDMLEPDLDLEADLGIDTVKQAELFGIVREKWRLPQEEDLQIKDYPTLVHIADYIVSRSGSRGAKEAATPTPAPQEAPQAPPEPKREDSALGRFSRAQPQHPEPARSSVDATPSPPGLDDLDDGAPSMGPPQASRPPATPSSPASSPASSASTRRAAPELDGLGDGAPSIDQAATAPAQPAAPPAASSTPPATATDDADPSQAEEGAQGEPAPPGDPEARAHAADHAQVVQRVTRMVAEQTGYPEDMLEPELDLEADLGVDTVKQAELFGVVRELYGLPLPEGLKIADYPTISRVADFVVETAGAQSAVAGSPGSALETGSPQEAFPAAPPSPAPTEPLESHTGQPQEGSSNDGSSMASPVPRESEPVPVRRFAVVPVDASLAETPKRDQAIEGILLITQDRLGWAERFAERFSQAGVTVALLGHTQPHDSVPGYFLPTELSDPESVEKTVAAVRDRLGPIGGIVHLAGLAGEHGPENPPAMRSRAREGVRSLYVLARAAQEDLMGRPGRPVISLTRMGGTFALPEVDGSRPLLSSLDPVHGGVAGLTKALAKELPSCFVRVVDLGVEVGPQEAVRMVLQELAHATNRTEVGYPALDRRVELEVLPRETSRAEAHRVFRDDHIVASGGAQGVTAACLAALVQTVGPDEAPALTLLGRTRLPPDVEALSRLDESQLAERKKALLARLREQHDRVTPVMLEREWSREEKAIEVHKNIEKLRALGARVEYFPVDIQDHEAVSKVMESAREKQGPVTGLLHGAGLEVSKALADKDVDQFDSVFDTKAVGMMNLVWAAREDPVRQVCVFSSVAGRFGNLGQVDYSAANDLAVRIAVELDRLPGVRGHAIDWSAWSDVGMATKGGIMQVMQAAGVTPIPLSEGTRMFVQEWITGDLHPEVVIAGRVGQIDADRQVQEETLPPVLPSENVEGVESMPLLDGFISLVPQRFAVATRSLRLDRDLYLDDHRVDSVAYLPGVFGVEMFAEAAESLLTTEEREAGCTFTAAEDIEYRLPVKLLRERALDVRVVVERITPVPEPRPPEPQPDPDGTDSELLGASVEPEPVPLVPVKVRCRLESDFVNESGRLLGETRVHFVGNVVLGVPEPHPVNRNLPIAPGESVVFDHGDVYDHFFHGPTFQVLDSIARIEGPNVAAVARFELDALFADTPRPRFRTAPLLREAMFQASGFWALSERETMSLPAGIRRITHYTQPAEAPPGTSLIVVARHERDVDEQHSEYTVEAYTPEGLLVDRMEGFRMIRTGTHQVKRPDDAPPGDPRSASSQKTPGDGPAAPSPSQPRSSGFEVVQEDEDWELEVRDPEGSSAMALLPLGDEEAVRVSVHRLAPRLDDESFLAHWFHPEEARRLRGMRFAKRRTEHAAGLMAAKNAVSWALKKRGHDVPARSVAVNPDPGTRAPCWSVPGAGRGLPTLQLTLSHSGPHAVALAVPEGDGCFGVGLDVESVVPRQRALEAVAFTPEEIKWLHETGGDLAQRTALLWTVKEAVAKGLRCGLALDLHDLQVGSLRSDGTAFVDLVGGAQTRLARLAGARGGAVRVAASTYAFSPGHVAAVARFIRDAS